MNKPPMKLLLLSFFLISFPVISSVQILGTRVIFNEVDDEVTVAIMNNNDTPRLIQAWVDEDEKEQMPDKANGPFLVMPPIFKLSGKKQQRLRLVALKNEIEQSSIEKVYYLNVYEVPPSPENGGNFFQFAIKSRIKIFYRPKLLKNGPGNVKDSMEWRLGATSLECINKSPFNISFSAVKLVDSNEILLPYGGMCSPLTTTKFPLKGNGVRIKTIDVPIIDDYGGVKNEYITLNE